MKRLNAIDWVIVTLLIIGGLNWGLVGFFEFDLVAEIFGGATETASRVVYAVVGLSALYALIRMPLLATATQTMEKVKDVTNLRKAA